MTNYNNLASREEKAEAFRNEQRLRQGDRDATSYHQLSRLNLDEEGGRFAQARHVSGSASSVDYPAAAPPWQSQSDAGLEPPLNQDVNEVLPVGEQWEIEKALSELAQDGQGCEPICAGEDNADQLVEAVALTADANAVVKSRADNSPACAETGLDQAPPPDGLDDVPRRSDGMPLSSHAVKPMRRKLK